MAAPLSPLVPTPCVERYVLGYSNNGDTNTNHSVHLESHEPSYSRCNREKFGGVGRLFAVLLVLLNCLTESTFFT